MKKSNASMKSFASILGLFVLGVVVLQSCKSDPNSPGFEYMPDMYRSPSYETYGTGLEPTGASARVPAENSIAMGEDNLPYPYPNTFEGYEAAGMNLKNPLAWNDENIAKGKANYMRFCVHCHGKKGKGDGTVPTNSEYPNPPAYDAGLKDLPAGKMFHSLQWGKNLMGSHASQMTKTERWEVILYVQTLQGKTANDLMNVAPADSASAAEGKEQ
ncbi:MAG: cytochrome C [Crocinitomicaceae bacterium]|nr:cytochrome C [Crocinitomicaceae bacterium]|tara:strand:- start:49496 stop:50140 length:645 start_codon:yes stop_codon:yes gene_type:complete